MILRRWKALLAVFVVPTLYLAASPASAGWEAGAKAGFDTNLSRSIDDGEGSGYLSAYGSYWKGHAAETRLDWTMGFTVQGAVYPSLSEVDYAAAMLSPGVAYIIRPGWTVALTPYLLGKAVKDSEQSAWAFGGRVDFSQKFVSGIYLGEYYVYTDSRANEDVYSYKENTLGLILGMRWTPKIFTEAGYEFSGETRSFPQTCPPRRLEAVVQGEAGGGTPPPSGPKCTRKRWMPTHSRSPPGSTGRSPGFRP